MGKQLPSGDLVPSLDFEHRADAGRGKGPQTGRPSLARRVLGGECGQRIRSKGKCIKGEKAKTKPQDEGKSPDRGVGSSRSPISFDVDMQGGRGEDTA